jgi:hypothetical protein
MACHAGSSSAGGTVAALTGPRFIRFTTAYPRDASVADQAAGVGAHCRAGAAASASAAHAAAAASSARRAGTTRRRPPSTRTRIPSDVCLGPDTPPYQVRRKGPPKVANTDQHDFTRAQAHRRLVAAAVW